MARDDIDNEETKFPHQKIDYSDNGSTAMRHSMNLLNRNRLSYIVEWHYEPDTTQYIDFGDIGLQTEWETG